MKEDFKEIKLIVYYQVHDRVWDQTNMKAIRQNIHQVWDQIYDRVLDQIINLEQENNM